MPRTILNHDRAVASRTETLYQRYGGYMTVSSVMKELGVANRKTAMKFLSDIPAYCLTGKKSKRSYDIRDIAAKIESSRVPAKGA